MTEFACTTKLCSGVYSMANESLTTTTCFPTTVWTGRNPTESEYLEAQGIFSEAGTFSPELWSKSIVESMKRQIDDDIRELLTTGQVIKSNSRRIPVDRVYVGANRASPDPCSSPK